MRLVVDASVAVKWLIFEDESEIARALVTDSSQMPAPRLMAAEIANVLWRKAQMRQILRSETAAMMAAVREMLVEWSADEIVCEDVVRLALSLDRPVYGRVYLALAHRIGAPVVTVDRRYANALATTEHGYAVVALADYAKARS